jgi:TIR domain
VPEEAAIESSPNAAEPTVFLSYSRQDFAVVLDLYHILAEDRVLRPWLDLVELRGGRDWTPQIMATIGAAEYFVLVVSRDSMCSDIVRKEWQRAREKGIPIVLVRIDSAILPPELVDCRTYDVRRRFAPTARTLRGDIATGLPAGSAPRLAGLPPVAVALVVAGHLVVMGWLGYLSTIAWTAALGESFPVRLGWFGTFTFHFTPLGVRCVACAAAASFLFQAYAVFCVIRRRIRPLRLIFGIVVTALFVAVSDVYLIAVQNSSRVAVPFPASGLWHHLLTQDALIALSIVIAAMIWRHPDLNRRASVGSIRRPEFIDGDLDDLSFVHRQAVERWIDRVLPKWTNGPFLAEAGTIAISGDTGDDILVGTMVTFCGRLGFRRVDEGCKKIDHLIILVGPRTDQKRYTAQAATGTPQAVFVLVDSVQIAEDAAELREAQWVDLRRQDVRSFRDLARALLKFAPPSQLIPSPVAPARFVSPRPITDALSALVAQSTLALQFGIVQLATPPPTPAWRMLSTGIMLVLLVVNTLMAVALVRRSWSPRTFRWFTAFALFASAVTDFVLLRDTGWLPLAIVTVTLLLAMQLLIYGGCTAVTYSMWMSRGAAGGPGALTLKPVWPPAVAGLYFLLVASPVFLGFAP